MQTGNQFQSIIAKIQDLQWNPCTKAHVLLQNGKFVGPIHLIRLITPIKQGPILTIQRVPHAQRRVRDLDNPLDLDPNLVLAFHRTRDRLPILPVEAEAQRLEPGVLEEAARVSPLGRRARIPRDVQVLPHPGGDVRRVQRHPAPLQAHHPIAELRDGPHVVADEQDRPALPVAHLVHLSHALLLELCVPHRQDLVDHQDLRIQVSGHGEGQAHVHAAGVALHRRVQKLLHPREVHDGVEVPPNLRLAHPKDGAVQIDVLPPRQLGVKARPDLQQTGDAPPEGHAPRRGLRDAAQDLEQRGLARTVASDDPDALPLLDLEGEVRQRPEILDGRISPPRAPRERMAQPAPQAICAPTGTSCPIPRS